jgi:RimJ/RimL family protein N-acetyltransferase
VLRATTDGVVTIRPPISGDAARLVAGRDEEFRRFLGEGDAEPRPVGCITVGDVVAGWVDHDQDREWLLPGEVNLGYNVFAGHRGRGIASRSVQLVMHHLAVSTDHRTATLLIDARNTRSLALAHRLRFEPHGDLDGHPYFTRQVPPLTYTDGEVTIRPQHPDDLEADLGAKDEEQIRWLWLPGQAESWRSMTESEQRAHAVKGLRARHEAFGSGPRWLFAVDTATDRAVANVECDLANERVPHGEANISYWSHPEHRGRGCVSRGVRLLMEFLRDHTGARQAHLITDVDNTPSRRVAAAVGAVEGDAWVDELGHQMLRHVLPV